MRCIALRSGTLGALWRSPKGLIPAVTLVIVALAAVLAPWISPHDPYKQDLLNSLQAPAPWGGTWEFPLGTDYHGRDILSRILFGSRVSLSVSLAGVAVATVAGVSIGLISGYFGGRVDDVLMRVADISLAFPPIVLAVAVLALFPPNVYLVSLVIAFTTWVWFARTVRSIVLQLKSMEFVVAAQAIGVSHARIIFRHLLPNVLPVVIATGTTLLGFGVLLEASLSFFGLTGTTLSWGWDIAYARDFIAVGWWMVTMPGLALFITSVSLNLFGDWLRDRLDPRLSRLMDAGR